MGSTGQPAWNQQKQQIQQMATKNNKFQTAGNNTNKSFDWVAMESAGQPDLKPIKATHSMNSSKNNQIPDSRQQTQQIPYLENYICRVCCFVGVWFGGQCSQWFFRGLVTVVSHWLRFVVFCVVFVEFVAFLGFGPGWLVLSMALQLKDLLFLLSAVRDLLCFGWYLLNLLVLLVSGLAGYSSLWGHRLFS